MKMAGQVLSRQPMSGSAIIRYYSGEGMDGCGRTLAETQALDPSRMEYYHDFIQWMFPIRQPSAYNPGAPTLTDEDVAAFRARPELRANLHRSFVVFLRFLGLALDESTSTVCQSADSRARLVVFSMPNHNWLRITRVLHSLKTLGLERECQAFFNYLETLNVPAESFRYWSEAARGTA
jgi:Opioid growth factor receptor (OGFr) conserved region